jgi:hypothetical protein
VGLFEQKTIQNQSCFFLVVPRGGPPDLRDFNGLGKVGGLLSSHRIIRFSGKPSHWVRAKQQQRAEPAHRPCAIMRVAGDTNALGTEFRNEQRSAQRPAT